MMSFSNQNYWVKRSHYNILEMENLKTNKPEKQKIVPKVPVSLKYKFHSRLGSCLFDNFKFRFYIHPTQEIENVNRNLK